MIYLRFQMGGQTKYGILAGKTVQEISSNYYGPFKKTGRKFPLSKVKLAAPCQPGKVIALGLNFLEHIKEMRMPMPLQPILFLKAPSAVIGTGENIVYPSSSSRVDYEGELAIVIKKKAKDLSPRRAAEHILGYTCFNDVTARDLQKVDGQWLLEIVRYLRAHRALDRGRYRPEWPQDRNLRQRESETALEYERPHIQAGRSRFVRVARHDAPSRRRYFPGYPSRRRAGVGRR